MRELVIDYGVPVSLFVLMTIVGTELVLEDLKRVARHPRAVLLGVAGQLIVLPPLVLLIAALTGLGPFLTTSLLLLSLCPGGAISNYYSYLARCNVSLAATITALGTLCSLVSIPLWLAIIGRWTPLAIPDRDRADIDDPVAACPVHGAAVVSRRERPSLLAEPDTAVRKRLALGLACDRTCDPAGRHVERPQ